MNKQQVKGVIKQAAGKVQQKAGELTGNRSQQLKGVGKQAEGEVQEAVGNVREAQKDADRK